MKKRRNQGWVPFLLGLALLLGAWLLLKLIPGLDAEHWRVGPLRVLPSWVGGVLPPPLVGVAFFLFIQYPPLGCR